jgi:putative membrane protein
MRGRDVALIIGAIAIGILLVGLLSGGMMTGWGGMGPGMMGWGGVGFNPLGWIAMLLFWGVIIGGITLLALWLFRQATPAALGPGQPSRPIEILKERYARGEITREQYEEMRREIEER